MKRLIKTMKQLGVKAEHWRDLVEQAPEQAAKLQQAFHQTAGQLHQLRSDVQSGFKDLKADDDGQLMKVLAEIHDHADVLADAGYEITGVDMELGLVRRVIVQLEQHEAVSASVISSLRARHHQQKAVQALLNGLIQAQELAGRVAIPGLPRFVVSVQLGSAPSIRVGWRPELGFDDEEAQHASAPAAPPPVPPKVFTPPALPDDLAGGFFARREPSATAAEATKKPAPPEPAPAPGPVPTATYRSDLKLTSRLTAAEPSSSEDWRKSALDRFKKMPKL